jgi:hypothetical protein
VVARHAKPSAGACFWLAAFHFNVLFGPRKAPLSKPGGMGCFPALTEIKPADRAVVKLTHCMDNFVFKCPRTGMNVQHRLADEPAAGDPHGAYETVLCPACSGLHFVHRSSRKLLGEQGE